MTVTGGGLAFTDEPAIDNSGTLTYAPAPDANGTATVSVTATDSGSGTPPNDNTSEPQTFTITVDAAANSAPTITSLNPNPDSRIKKRKPTISTTVKDAETDLTKADIELLVDGEEITSFTYDARRDRLKYRVKSGLDPGEHTLEVTATDVQNLSTTEEWSFEVNKN